MAESNATQVILTDDGIKIIKAQNTADNAASGITNLNDPNLMSVIEKQNNIGQFAGLTSQYNVIMQNAKDDGIDTTALTTAYNNLNQFMADVLADPNHASDIDRATYKKYQDAYNEELAKTQNDFKNSANNEVSSAANQASQAASAASQAFSAAQSARNSINNLVPYTHIAYANSADGKTDFSLSDSNRTYLGMYVDFASTDSNDPLKYAWSLIKGHDGEQGIPGKAGADGKTPYFHIAYADNATGTEGFSTTDSLNKPYIGQYTDYVQADSTDPTKYLWTLIKGDKGADGDVGPKGDQGIKGPAGADGRTSYAHFAYANSQDGNTDFSTTDANHKYIGFYSDFSSGDSNNPSDYSWSLIKGADGADGKDGVPGKAGADGKTPYFHIAYADSSDGNTNFSLDTPGSRKYIGSYTDFTQADSTNPALYSWQLVQGPKGDTGAQGLQGLQGPQGNQGIKGPAGADGKSSYTHIAYSNSADGKTNFTVSDSNRTYIGVYVDQIVTDSKDPTKYAWSLIKGADGANGAPGKAGADGKTPYFHQAWADSSDGTTNFSTTVSLGKKYLGTYTDYVAADSKDPTIYKWTELVGAIQVGGRNLYLNSKAIADGYGINSSATVTVEPFDSATNMWHIVAGQGNGNRVGIYLYNYGDGKMPNSSDWAYSADVKGTAKTTWFGIENGDHKPIVGTVGSEWSRISQTGHFDNNEIKTIVMYFDSTNSPVDVYIKLPKLESGNMPTDWTPAPEDLATQSQIIKLNNDINLNVKKGDLLSQINLQAGYTLVSASKQLTLSSKTIYFDSANPVIIPSANIDKLLVDKKLTAADISANTFSTNNETFTVKQDGSVTAKNMTLNGGTLYSPTINTSTINGSTINGTTFNAGDIISDANNTAKYYPMTITPDGAYKSTYFDSAVGLQSSVESGAISYKYRSMIGNGAYSYDNVAINGQGITLDSGTTTTKDTNFSAAETETAYISLTTEAGLYLHGSNANIDFGGHLNDDSTSVGMYMNPYGNLIAKSASQYWQISVAGSDNTGGGVVARFGIDNASAYNIEFNRELDIGNFQINTGHTFTSADGGAIHFAKGRGGANDIYAGDVHYNSLVKSSLLSVKKDVKKVDTAYWAQLVNSIDLATYQYKSDDNTSHLRLSSIVDDVNVTKQWQLPDVFISRDENGKLNGVDDSVLLNATLATVQEQQREIDQLNGHLLELEAKLNG